MEKPLNNHICYIMLDLQGFFATNIENSYYKQKECIEVSIEKDTAPYCSKCNSIAPIHDHRIRKILHTAISFKLVVLKDKLRRTACQNCSINTEKQDIAEGKNRHSKLLGKLIIELLADMSNAAIGRILGLDLSTVYRIDKIELEKKSKNYLSFAPNIDTVALDEIGYKKRHKYATVLTNHEDGKVIDISMGKSKQSAIELFKKHDRRLRWVDSVTIDFSASYISAVSYWWNEHNIVFDKFHLSRLVNRKIEEVRREIQQNFDPVLLRQSKKQDRWLVLTRSYNHE
jgi:transposase